MDVRRLAPLAAAAAAALVLVVLVAPEIIRGSFSDLDTFVRSAGLVVVLGLWVVAARRVIPHRTTGAVVAAVPVLVALWFVLWPYVRPATEVDEAFPVVTADTVDAIDPVDTVDAIDPVDTVDAIPTTSTTTTTVPPAPDAAADASTTTSTVAPEPVELARGSFQGLTGHRGSGDAALYRLADDSLLLRFEEVDIGSGPDLEVYLVPGADQRGLGGGHHVASLTAERGNQNYTVPDGVDLETGEWTVLVWCETFVVEVANATLTV